MDTENTSFTVKLKGEHINLFLTGPVVKIYSKSLCNFLISAITMEICFMFSREYEAFHCLYFYWLWKISHFLFNNHQLVGNDLLFDQSWKKKPDKLVFVLFWFLIYTSICAWYDLKNHWWEWRKMSVACWVVNVRYFVACFYTCSEISDIYFSMCV